MVRQLPPTDAEVPLAQGIISPDAPESTPAKTKASRASQKPVEPSEGADATDDPAAPLETPSVALQVRPQAPAPTVGRYIDLPELSAAPTEDENRWSHWLNATAGKLGKTRQRLQADTLVWESAVAGARKAGVDEYVIIAAAMRARVYVPEVGSDQPGE